MPTPPTPSDPTVAPTPEGASITVTTIIPAPTGGETAAGYYDVYRTDDAGLTATRIGKTVPPGEAFVDFGPASGVDYGYRVIAVTADGTRGAASGYGGLAIRDLVDGGDPSSSTDVRDGGSPTTVPNTTSDGGGP